MKNRGLLIVVIMMSAISIGLNFQTVPEIVPLETPTTASLRGLHALDASKAWASGSGGIFLRTTDGGITWDHGTIVDTLDFRDIYAFDENQAIVISAGHPATIFKTVDAGNNWDLKYKNLDERVFFDAIDFWNSRDGIAFSDAVDGYFYLIITHDGGESWSLLETLPKALEGEGGFAASGTNMIIGPDGEILIGTTAGRLLTSDDKGKTWTWIQSLLESTKPTSGIFSLASNEERALMVGGDFTDEKGANKNAAYMDPAGKWYLSSSNPGGYRSGVAFVPGAQLAICTGPGGTDYSEDGGNNWVTIDSPGFHAVSFGSTKDSGWLSGSDGRVARIRWK